MINIRSIVQGYLILMGHDGLCSPTDDCGCGIDDFMPCCGRNFNDGPSADCVPAHKEKDDAGCAVYRPIQKDK